MRPYLMAQVLASLLPCITKWHTEALRASVPQLMRFIANATAPFYSTVESALKDHPIGHKNVVCQDRWSLTAVVSQDRFHCTGYYYPGCVCYGTATVPKVRDLHTRIQFILIIYHV